MRLDFSNTVTSLPGARRKLPLRSVLTQQARPTNRDLLAAVFTVATARRDQPVPSLYRR